MAEPRDQQKQSHNKEKAFITVQVRVLQNNDGYSYQYFRERGLANPQPIATCTPNLLNVEIISLPICTTKEDFYKKAYKACRSTLGVEEDRYGEEREIGDPMNRERNGQQLRTYQALSEYVADNGYEDPNTIKRVIVEWEPDMRGNQTWTEIHDGNVKAVLRRLKAREEQGRSDMVIMLYP